jgi:hypothetical protein
MRTRIQSKNGKKEINLNRRKAVRERCLNCSAWSFSEVEGCEFIDCDLYAFRMGIGKQNADKRHKAIRNYCLYCCAENQYAVYLCPATDCPLYAYRKSHIDNSVKIDSIRKIGHIERSQGTFSSKGISEYGVI